MKVIFCKTGNILSDEVFGALIKRISKDRREELIKNKSKESACTKLLSHICLRTVLCGMLGQKNSGLEFFCGENGKPYVKNNAVYFNLSHTHGAFALAFSNFKVGIDIERKREISQKLKEKLYSPLEKEQDEMLVWTKKEAFLKLSGKGLKEISKADTENSEIIFFCEKIGDYTLSAASYADSGFKLIETDINKIIREGCLLEEI